ncbi:isochorismatase family protein [Enterococcus sp. ZJ1622]|uniref:isochorismatase family protein n=1 Tax=Enterococcus sp. ZJ1622 TaxID=2709401 RepID=UPI0013EC75C7|nr:isochorismatase family protein [Enterococcus sp. ZJ1622]
MYLSANDLISDLSKTAFLAIDLQKGIVENGTLLPYDNQTILKKNQQLAAALMNTAAMNILVNVDIETFRYLSKKNDVTQNSISKATPPAAISKEFTDLLLAPALEKAANTLTITKHNPSAFFGTSLDLQLRRRGIDTLILSGVATSNGVYATALDAFQYGYHVIVAEDACSDREEEIHRLFVEKIFPRTTRVRSTETILSAIKNTKDRKQQ